MPESRNDGAPAASSNMRSAIIIGLGGTGLEVLTMVKRMIVERFGGLEQLPIIAFLHLDTATEEAKLTPASVLGHNLSLTQAERLTLRMPIINDGGADYLAKHPMIREWFPPTLRIEHDFARGAGAVRAYGRLALAENARQFESALNACAERVNDDNQRRFVAERYGAVDDGLDVYLVCSLLGGTGSGTFLDAAYLARHVVQRFHSNTQVLGYLVVGGGNSVDNKNLANCYGALKELAYYSTQALKLKDDQASVFSVQYPRMNRLESKAAPPFNFCYLATNFNEQQVQFSKEALFELVAQNIFLEFTPGVAASKRGIRNNIAAQGFTDLDGRLQQAQSFLSFGLSTIEFPALRVQDCLAYRLAGEALEYFSFSNAPTDSALTQQVKQEWQDWGLAPEPLLKALITDEGGRTLRQQAAELKNRKQTELQRYLPRPQRDHLLVYLRNHLDSARSDVNIAADPAARGAHIKQIELKAQNLLDAAVNQLRRRVAEKLSSPYGGVKNTVTYLQTLAGDLKTFEKNFRTAEELQERKAHGAAERETKAAARVGRERYDANDGEMRTLVNDALGAAYEFSEATLLAYANRQARLLLAGETDEQGRWLGECLLREIKRLHSQIDEFAARLRAFSTEFVGQRERDESGREIWSGGKYSELRQNLTAGAYNSDVLVEPGELDALYQSCLAHPKDEYVRLKDELERRLGAGDAPRSIFWCVLEQPEQVRNLSVEASRQRFEQVRNISIAKKLAAQPQADVERRIQEAARRAHVLVRFDSASLFAADDATGKPLTSHEKFHEMAMLATCQPQDDPDVNLDPAPGQPPSKLALAFRTQTNGIKHEKALPDRYRLVFVHEKGVFPLYCLADLKQLHTAYRHELQQHNAKPRETDCRLTFPDLFPPDPRETAMPGRTARALTLGRLFQHVRAGRAVRTEEPVILYAYRDEHHTRRELVLGRDWEDAARQLAERQINKEIYRERTAETTPLEHLEKTLEQEGRTPVSLSEKEAAWQRLQDYLLALEGEFPDGERHPRYQQEAEILNQFRSSYGWAAPPGWHRPPLRETAPVSTPTQPFNHAAPTQLAPYPAVNGAANAAHEADVASFRQRVALKLRRTGALPLAEITKLMQEGIEDYGLTPAAAKALLDEAQQQAQTAAEPDTRSAEKYRELCQDILAGGEDYAANRAVLEDKRRRLNLTPAQAQVLEEQVLSSATTP